MVRIIASVLSALALSRAVLAIPTMRNSESYDNSPSGSSYSGGSASSPYGNGPSNYNPSPVAASPAVSASESKSVTHGASTAPQAYGSTTSAATHHATSTSAAPAQTTSAAPSYGSGSSNWGTDLNSCVQMCQARFGMSPPAGSPPPTTTTAAAPTGTGTGVVHTVIVAPSQGVLRYVPFAVNASVGDTVRFMWGANRHTVTKSSALTVCNKSADASTFASGVQNATFVFDQVVNTTEPTFFFCAVPTHCQKGMFGIINPPSAPSGSASTVGQMMSTWASQNPDIAKMRTAVDDMTKGTPAHSWATNLDVSSIPTEAHQSLVENVFYTRMFYAANTGASEGASRPDGQPLTIPADVNSLVTNAPTSSSSPANNGSGTSTSATPSSTSAPSNSSPRVNGASNVVASSALFVIVAVASSLFLI